ncbi:hypothetical protein F4814DRAFT_195560 [Daldinia grandis]|nr:hypothetical protein F4814DRAFT_195560 [Daldinia grandis]
MSVPPQLIRVKRKATEEAPVSFLRVQENKRHRSEAFVYQRQQERANSTENIPSESHKPIIHTSHPHSKTPAFQSPKTSDTIVNDGSSDNETASESSESASPVDTLSEPRRFHMSRKDIMLATASQPGRPHGVISKKRSAPALFVERKIKRISSRPLEKFQAITNAASQISGSAPAAAKDMEIDKPEPRKLKKPGVAKLAKKQDGEKYKADLPQSITERWNVDIEKLTAELDAYTMEQIGLNLQKAEEEKRQQRTAANQHRFKPKQIKRYAERHPGEIQASADRNMTGTDIDISDSDDSDYIIETYERVPASKMGEHVPPHSVGLLVFDEEPDMEYFYGEDDNSEDEWAEDEEDENAENYYAADYPDEEVASDDEFDKNPYSFRTGNASDLEEYDLDEDDGDAAFTDKDEASRFAAYISRPRDRFMANQL